MSRRLLILLGCAVIGVACNGGSDEPSSPSDDEQFLEDTATAHQDDTPEPSPATDIAPTRAVVGTELAYGESVERNLVGYVAMPEDAAEPLPGIIVIHEWWGLNDNIRAMAERIAGEGYIALAIDLYGGQVAEDPAQAQEMMQQMYAAPEAIEANLRQAHQYLTQYAFSPRVASLGWCLGGGVSLSAGLWMPEELDAVVMYYGRVTDDEVELGGLTMPLLGLFAADDTAIKVADVQRFRNTLNRLGKDATVQIFPDVGHAFANPSGGNFNAAAAEEAWVKTLEFLTRTLKDVPAE
ncbi:MAG: dienelactone hydrolase family protein [Gammaproteobacteria bacterium]